MTENGFKYQENTIKNEPEVNSLYKIALPTNDEILSIHKELVLSPLNYDYDNVDFESINIDDIFNESHSSVNWSSKKDEHESISKFKNELIIDTSAISNIFNNSGDDKNQNNKTSSDIDENKLFLITNMLSKDQYFLEDNYNSTTNAENSVYTNYENGKPQLTLLLNPQNVFNNDPSMISNQRISYKSDSFPGSSNNRNVNKGVNFIPIPSSPSAIVSKTKSILPVIEPSPKKKSLVTKTGKLFSQLCSICNDNATGKHYGVISCEGCKGFFKRTIRNGLSYTCRDFNNCAVDKKFRNRCQSCRFQKCQQVGMKREAVHIDRSILKGHKSIPDSGVEPVTSSPSSAQTDESLEKIHSNLVNQINSEYMMQIEMKYNPEVEVKEVFEGNVMKVIFHHVNEHLFSIVSWAKYMPGFTILSLNDQTLLIKMCWGELVIANFTHRSLKLNDDIILLRNGMKLVREMAQSSGLGKLIDRIFYEVLHRFRDLKINRCELSYLKAIILFNPNLKNLENRSFIQMIRDKLYTSLQNYCQENFPQERFRFSKLLLRLPSLRSIAHHCLDHFRFYDIIDKYGVIELRSDNGNNAKSEHTGFSFLDEMLGHSDIIMDH